ncbi:MAG: dihydrofolate reductase [Rikenellaceae bacterium]
MRQEQFSWVIDRFDDIKVLRYKVPGFEELDLGRKQLIYHLYKAALWGRDIFTDQNFQYNLPIRSLLEKIYLSNDIDKECSEFKFLEKYLKKVWFANGIHHHYSSEKFIAEFSREYFVNCAKTVGETSENIELYSHIIFDDCYKVNCSQNRENDLLLASSSNYYRGVTQAEAEQFYGDMAEKGDKLRPISYGLNSRLVKNENGELEEIVYKVGGLYSGEIEKIVEHLTAATEFCENSKQRAVIESLIEYYKSGDLAVFDKYNILWLDDKQSHIDFVNGFIEVYGDPLGYKASWEANVNFINLEATRRTEIISSNAQWFEDNSPINPKYKKSEVKGVSAKVITVAAIGGDCFPATPIGINLPNSDWLRKEYGSKSVTIQNITDAYAAASLGDGFAKEFTLRSEDLEIAERYGALAGNLHTDLHECLGHGSGQLAQGVKGDELRNYGSALEESRADLFALYYLGDEKLIELGIVDSMEVMKAAYYNYIFNGLMGQLVRIEKGKNIVQAHMRDRQMVASWCYEQGRENKVIEIVVKDNKRYVVINDYAALRSLFAELLCEVQRIKSEGDFEAGRDLIENYGVKVDDNLHSEVLERYAALDLAPYSGFVNPRYTPIIEGGEIIDIEVSYSDSFAEQMLEYSEQFIIHN